jgi:hypothetical protein
MICYEQLMDDLLRLYNDSYDGLRGYQQSLVRLNEDIDEEIDGNYY